MILRKPYALFIKMFKPIHLVLGVLIAYLITLENRMLSFFTKNMYSANNFIGQGLKDTLVSSGLYIIPVVVMLLCILILIIMFNRKKPYTFYVISIFCCIAILIINGYVIGFIETLDETIVTVRSMKLAHDLTIITMGVEVVLLVIMIIRGAGVNIRKFNFDSDISKIDIKESDSEEFEVDIKFSLDETKREKNRKIRYLKYVYEEKKLLINIIAIGVILLITASVFLILGNREKIYSENTMTRNTKCNFSVDSSYAINASYDGKVITNNYLVVVDVLLKLNYEGSVTLLNDFVLNIGNNAYFPTKRYNKYILDLGTAFNDNLTAEFNNYLIVYEIPKEKINSKMTLTYNDGNKLTYIRLKPITTNADTDTVTAGIGEEMKFSGKFEGVALKINELEIQKSFTINYDFCIKTDDCVASREYIKPSINQNFDKSVMRINIDYTGNANAKTFYKLLNTFGRIEYIIDGKTKYQSGTLEEISSLRKPIKNIIYLGVNNELEKATSIYFVFNLRGKEYRYQVK